MARRPRFKQFGALMQSRVMPAFDGSDEEAHASEHRRYNDLMPGVPGADEDDCGVEE